MNLKGFTILEATFSIAILSFAIAFSGYLIFNGLDIFNQTKLINLAQQSHQNSINNIYSLLNTNSLRFPEIDECKLTSVDTIAVQDCKNFSSFLVNNKLETFDLSLMEDPENSSDLENYQLLYCVDENCIKKDYQETQNRKYYITNKNNLNGDLIQVQTYYYFDNRVFTITSNIKI